MITRQIKTGYGFRVKLTAAISGAAVVSALVAATLTQPSIAYAIQDGKGLAELAGRSPGKRIGGIALKGKVRGKKAKPSPVRTVKQEKPRGSQAVSLAKAVVPEGPVPGFLPAEELPGGFTAPPVPVETLQQVADFTTGPSFPGGSLFYGPLPGPTGPGIGIGGIPEPGTWLTLIVGFGMLGARMRRRPLGTAATA